MIYQYDQALPLPTKDLYDTQIMQMAVAAAKDMYDRGEKRIDEFYDKYGDFYSPIASDVDFVHNETIGKLKAALDYMQANGIDPLRSSEGRALVQQAIRNVDTKAIAFKKLRAKNAEEYYKNMGELKAKGLYNDDFSRYLQENPDQWAENFAGVTSPTQFQTLKEATNEWYNNRTPRDLTTAEKKQLGLDSRYNYTGYFDSDLLNVAKGNTPGWQGSPVAGYYRELAKRKLQQSGVNNPTADQIEAVLQRDIANAQQEWLVGPVKGDADAFVLDDYRTKNDIRANNAKAATDYYYSVLPYADSNGDGKISREEMQDYVRLNQQTLKHKGSKTSSEGGDTDESGYNIASDVYMTTLSKGAGMEYTPAEGVSPNDLSKMMKEATKRQNAAIGGHGSVLSATGMFISPQKISGLIQYDDKQGDGYFLNSGYFKNLHDMEDLRTSYKGWLKTGATKEQSMLIRKDNKQRSKDIISGINEWRSKGANSGRRLKVVQTVDENGNNVYGMVGDDNRWHTYALVRVYVSDKEGKTYDAGNVNKNEKNKQSHDIPKHGRLMALEIGLHSNEGKGSPDLSVSARENLGFYGFDATKDKIGLTGNSGFPYGTNILSDD